MRSIRKDFWNQQTEQRLIDLYPNHTNDDIAKIMAISPSMVKNRGFKLGLSKNGNTGRFKKGSIPANKGKKMDAALYQKCKPTMFKKGNVPATTKHFFKPYLYLRKGKGYEEKLWFIQIKAENRREPYLSYLCRQNGIDLKGKIPRLRDGFDINTVPTFEDIIIITYEENMRLNSVHNYPEEIRDLILIKGALNRQINKKNELRNNID